MVLILRREAVMAEFDALRFLRDDTENPISQQDEEFQKKSIALVRLRGILDRSLASLANGIKTPHV